MDFFFGNIAQKQLAPCIVIIMHCPLEQTASMLLLQEGQATGLKGKMRSEKRKRKREREITDKLKKLLNSKDKHCCVNKPCGNVQIF